MMIRNPHRDFPMSRSYLVGALGIALVHRLDIPMLEQLHPLEVDAREPI